MTFVLCSGVADLDLVRDLAQSAAAQRLGWALLHSLWQGLAAALLLALALAALRRRGPQARYIASCAALALMAVLPAATFVLYRPAPTRQALVENVEVSVPKHVVADGPQRAQDRAREGAERPADALVMPSAVLPFAAANLRQQPEPLRRIRDAVAQALPWTVVVWAAGVLCLSVWNVGGWVAVQRLKSVTTRPADAMLSARGARLADRMGLRRPVRLMESALASTPLVIGTLRPVILLPAAIVTGLPAAQLDAILLHELAHVRRFDYLVNLLQSAVETLMFYHPAVWWVSRRVRLERELCCDDAVVAVTGDAQTYARALAAVAETARFGTAAPALAPAAAGGPLLARVRRLLGAPDATEAHVPRRTAGAVALCLGILVVVAVVGRGAGAADDADNAAAPAAGQSAPGKRVLDFMVLDKAGGAPIRTSLRVRADSERWQVDTDAEGRCRVEYPAGAKYLQVFADHPLYVPTRAQFFNDLGNEPPPASYVLLVERGNLIGGTVLDEAGKPIDGATVRMDIFAAAGIDPRGREQIFVRDATAVTDKQGHWLFTRTPREFAINLRLTHPEYVSDVSPRTDPPPADKLRATTAVLVMKKGLAVAGRVVDAETGRPVAGAEVAQGRSRWEGDFPAVKTDEDGRFRFGGCKPGEMTLTVTAAGRAPEIRDVNVLEGMGAVEFRLSPSPVLRGRVVDTAGKPVVGATVGSDTWRGRRSLKWRIETDGDGRFVWNEAPPDEVLGYVGREGFAMLRDVPLVAGGPDKEQVHTLRRPLKVAGVVTDAETGKPVEQFTVVRGTVSGDGPVRWDREWGKAQGGGGRFAFEVNESRETHAVRIEAAGYAAAESRPLKFGEKDETVSLEFALKKSRGLTGVVRSADGTPVVGAELALATPGVTLYVRNGRLPASSLREVAHTSTDDFGRYRFPEQTGPFILVAVHDFGYAEVSGESLDKTGDVKLTPWATVGGTARVGSKPAAGQAVELDPDPAKSSHDRTKPSVTFRAWAIADDAGHFAFDRVPAGLSYVAKTVALGEGMSTSSHHVAVNLKPGEHAEVQVGGTGRPVVGRVVFAPEVNARPWRTDNSSILTKVEAQAAPKTPDRQPSHHFPLLLDRADGRFRVDDVPSGRYELRVSLAAAGTKEYETAGGLSHEFTVPEPPGGQSDEPLDLGTLTVTPAEARR